MSLQPTSNPADRTTTTPFLLCLYYRFHRPLEPYEFSIAPHTDTTDLSDYSSLLPTSARRQSVKVYTWPTCTFCEVTATSVAAKRLDAKQRKIASRTNAQDIWRSTRTAAALQEQRAVLVRQSLSSRQSKIPAGDRQVSFALQSPNCGSAKNLISLLVQLISSRFASSTRLPHTRRPSHEASPPTRTREMESSGAAPDCRLIRLHPTRYQNPFVQGTFVPA